VRAGRAEQYEKVGSLPHNAFLYRIGGCIIRDFILAARERGI